MNLSSTRGGETEASWSSGGVDPSVAEETIEYLWRKGEACKNQQLPSRVFKAHQSKQILALPVLTYAGKETGWSSEFVGIQKQKEAPI